MVSDINQPVLHHQAIAILGGTGKEGKGLAYRLAKNGYPVFIGSRSPEKANAVATELTNSLYNKVTIRGDSNIKVVEKAGIIILTVPYSSHRDMLETVKGALKGKLLIDVTVPLAPPITTRVRMPSAGSAAQEAHEILGDDVQVTSAFQNISYEQLLHDEVIDCDVLVTGTSKEARLETLKLVANAGFTGWDAGPIENSMVAEGLTSVLLGINKQFKSKSAGIRITGVHSTGQQP